MQGVSYARPRTGIINYGLSVYWLFYAAITGIFFKLHFINLKYTDDPVYNAKWDVHSYGLSRLIGNELKLHDPVMITLLVVGVVVGLVVLFQRHSNILMRLAGIFMIVGTVAPLLPPYTENILPKMFVSMILVTFASGLATVLVATHTTDPL